MKRDSVGVGMLPRNAFAEAGRMLAAMLCVVVLVAACEDRPTLTPKEFIERAEQHRKDGEYRAGVIQIKNALQQEPNNVDARILLGRIYLEAGDIQAAEGELERALDLKADPEELLEPLGRAWLARGRFEQVLDEIEAGDDATASLRAAILVLQGNANIGLGNTARANENFRAALALDPESAGAYVGLARLAMASKDEEKAKAAIDSAVDVAPDNPDVLATRGEFAFFNQDFDGAIDAYRRLTEIRKGNPFPRMSLAHAQIAAGKIEDAQRNIDRVLKLAPKNLLGLHLKALAAHQSGDFETAQAVANQVLAKTPDHLPSQLIVGSASYQLGHMEQAARYLGRYLVDADSDDAARRLHGAALIQMQRHTEALESLRPLLAGASDDVQALSLIGQAAEVAGDFEIGEQALARLANLNPDDPNLQMRLGLVRSNRGNVEEAVEDLEKAVELNPKDDRIAVALFATALRGGQFDKAQEMADRFKARLPNEPVGHNMEGIIHVMQRQFASARQAFERALDVVPGEPSASHSLANLDIADGRADDARARLTRSFDLFPDNETTVLKLADLEAEAGNWKAAVAWVDRQLEKDPTAARPNIALADILRRSGKAEEALAVLEGVPEDARSTPLFLRATGEAQVFAGNFEDAIRSLRQLVDAEPDSAFGHFMLATAYLNAGERAGVRRHLERSVELNPDHLPSKIYLTNFLIEERDFTSAQRYVDQLRAEAPTLPQVLESQGMLALARNQPEDAARLFKKAIDIHRLPTRTLAMNYALAQWNAGDLIGSVETLSTWLGYLPDDNQARAVLGSRYAVLGRFEDAKNAYAAVLDKQANAWTVRNNLALVLLDLGQAAEALKEAERAVRDSNDNPRVLDTAGVVAIEAGKPEQAVEWLGQAAAAEPGNPTIRYHQARALAAVGKTDEARKVLSSALEDNAEFGERAEAQQLLEDLGG